MKGINFRDIMNGSINYEDLKESGISDADIKIMVEMYAQKNKKEQLQANCQDDIVKTPEIIEDNLELDIPDWINVRLR